MTPLDEFSGSTPDGEGLLWYGGEWLLWWKGKWEKVQKKKKKQISLTLEGEKIYIKIM